MKIVYLSLCNQEEADTGMMVHAVAAMKSGHRRVLIRTVDADVVVLVVCFAQEMHEAVDSSDDFRYIAYELGPDKV